MIKFIVQSLLRGGSPDQQSVSGSGPADSLSESPVVRGPPVGSGLAQQASGVAPWRCDSEEAKSGGRLPPWGGSPERAEPLSEKSPVWGNQR